MGGWTHKVSWNVIKSFISSSPDAVQTVYLNLYSHTVMHYFKVSTLHTYVTCISQIFNSHSQHQYKYCFCYNLCPNTSSYAPWNTTRTSSLLILHFNEMEFWFNLFFCLEAVDKHLYLVITWKELLNLSIFIIMTPPSHFIIKGLKNCIILSDHKKTYHTIKVYRQLLYIITDNLKNSIISYIIFTLYIIVKNQMTSWLDTNTNIFSLSRSFWTWMKH